MASDLTALLDGPSGLPPAGMTSQLDDPPNYRTVTTVVLVISIVISTLAVIMRLYSRIFITKKFGFPDYTILLGYGFFIGFFAMCFIAAMIAPGIHMWNVRLRDLISFLYYLRMASILYAPTIIMIKLSILSQYIQVLMPNKHPRGLYLLTVMLIAANIAAYVVLLGLQIWNCKPIRASWDPLTPGQCINTLVLNVGASSVNVASDTAILLVPQAVIWRLQMPAKRKWGVSSIFFVAILAITSAAVRLYYTVQLLDSSDTTWFTWLTGIWALVEIDFGIIVACMPPAAAFFRTIGSSRWFSTLKDLSTWRRKTSSGGSMSRFSTADQESPFGQHDSGRGKPYGLSDLNSVATIEDSESARNLRGSAF